jgi:hypothetical protein
MFYPNGRMFPYPSSHYPWKLLHWYNGTGNIIVYKKVEPIIFLAVLIQKPVPNNLASVTLIEEYSIKLNYCGVLSCHKLPLAISTQATVVLQEQVKYYQQNQNPQLYITHNIFVRM